MDATLNPVINDLKKIINPINGKPIIDKPNNHITTKYNKLLVKVFLKISNFDEKLILL